MSTPTYSYYFTLPHVISVFEQANNYLILIQMNSIDVVFYYPFLVYSDH